MSENRTPEPERLYHYTNPKGLLGIAQSRVLWASNIRYLGDSSEYLHAVQLALSVVESAEDMTAQEREFFDYLLGKSEVGAWIRARLFGSQLYVVSLTKQPDLLSQWRAYAPKSGYCIGWRVDTLNHTSRRNGFDLKPCVYDRDEQQALVRPVIDATLRRLRESPCEVKFNEPFWAPRSESEVAAYTQLEIHTQQFDMHFSEIAAICKHYSFNEEVEWRLIYRPHPNGRAPVVRFREGRSVLIPYVEFGMNLEMMGISALEAQTEIICGPSPEIDLAQNSALHLIADWHGGARTSQSKTPYRDW